MLDLLLSDGMSYDKIPLIPDEYFAETGEIAEPEKVTYDAQIVPYPRLG